MWLFEPPKRSEPIGDTRDALWGRYSTSSGVAVGLLDNGSYGQFLVVDPEAYPNVTTWWQGGRVHEVTDAQATGLTAAGYGPFLTKVASS